MRLRVPLSENGRALYADADRWQGRWYVQVIDAETGEVDEEWPASKKYAAHFIALFNALVGVEEVRP